MSKKLRRKGVVSSGESNSYSLDWDSPSNKTGTVKRRPLSSDCVELKSKEILEDYLGSSIPIASGKTTKTTIGTNGGTRYPVKEEKVKLNSSNKIYPRQQFNLENQTCSNGATNNKKITLIPTKIKSKSKIKSVGKSFSGKLDDDDDNIIENGYKLDTTTEFKNAIEYLIEERKSRKTIIAASTASSITAAATAVSTRAFTAPATTATATTGKVSDSDSGIASPLSPSSLYGFPVCCNNDKNEERHAKDKVNEDKIKKQSISYFNANVKVRKITFFFSNSFLLT